VGGFVKVRRRADPGTIPDLLAMFENELRFYRDIAGEVGVRVPECYEATETADGFRLVLEDLSSWQEGGDPVQIARVLAALHRRWEGQAEARWPWLRRGGKAAHVIGELYDRVWVDVTGRFDLSPAVRDLGDRLVGKVAEIEREEAAADRRTLIQGDSSLRNTRTSPDGVVAFVDWEDVRSASGAVDLTWLLASSVPPVRWGAVIDAYSPDEAAFRAALPNAAGQAILSLGDQEPATPEAAGWIARIEAIAALVGRRPARRGSAHRPR
jgi:hypothetical protein